MKIRSQEGIKTTEQEMQEYNAEKAAAAKTPQRGVTPDEPGEQNAHACLVTYTVDGDLLPLQVGSDCSECRIAVQQHQQLTSKY